MLWIVVGTLSGACFALNGVLARRGMRHRASDNGLFMTILVNVVLLGLAVAWSGWQGLLPPWSWTGLAAFLAAGVVGTAGGRGAMLMAVRLVGPARVSAFQISAPVFTLFAGWALLGERLHTVHALGSLLVLLGLAVLVSARVTAEPLVAAAAGGSDEAAATAAGSAPAPSTSKLRLAAPTLRLKGYGYAVTAATGFGLAFVARKAGLLHYPSAAAGAFWGSVSSLLTVVGYSGVRGRLRQLVHDNLRQVPWWFVGAGAATGLALLLQFTALGRLPAWTAAVLHGTQALWVLGWSRLLLGREEKLGRHVIASVLLVFAGVVVLALGSR
ncbi:MAG TPA: DMT family transporter [Trueperaceae bacterium]